MHTYHGFAFQRFQSWARRGTDIRIERRLGKITDVAFCVGSGVATEAVRRRVITPERIRTIGVAVDTAQAAGASMTARDTVSKRRPARASGSPSRRR